MDLLVPVMKRLATWTRPVVMIPGNHDQVTLGGGMHALTPLQFAFSDPKQVGRADRRAARCALGDRVLWSNFSNLGQPLLESCKYGKLSCCRVCVVCRPWRFLARALTSRLCRKKILLSSIASLFNEQALVLSKPTLFLDALWIPHRRNNSEMEELLGSKEARGAR